MGDMTAGRSRLRSILIDRRTAPMLAAAAFFASIAAYWHGLGPGDAERYIRAAYDWFEYGFNLGSTHWSLRYPLVLPIAASFAILGANEFTATLPNIAYAGGLVAVTYCFARRYLGQREGTIAAIFIATSAFFVARPIELDAYGAEAFYLVLSCWLFVAAEIERRRHALLFAAGVSAGLAWLMREQTIYLMTAFGLITILSKRDRFLALLSLGVGFGAILLVEWIWYAIAAADPFYRYRIDVSHRMIGVEITIKGEEASFLRTLTRPFRDLLSYPTATPFLAMALIGAMMTGWRRLGSNPERRRALVTFCTASAIAIPICAYGFNLALPRYYPILTYAAYLVLAAAVGELLRRRRGVLAASIAAVIVFVNAAAADFSRYGEYAEARYLAVLAAKSPAPIATDPLTASRARYLMLLDGYSFDEASKKIGTTTSPTPDALYFKSHLTVRRRETWCTLLSADVRKPNWSHALIRAMKLDQIAGEKLHSIVARPRPVELVRVLDRRSDVDPETGAACLQGAG